MACFKPLSAFQLDNGDIVFVERGSIARALFLPCGQCIGCRLERSREWAVRNVHESQMHEHSVFVTLTYDDAHLNSPSLIYRDFQLFMKRLRKAKGNVRFYMSGEYGEGGDRPHFHALLFGCFFEDREAFRTLSSGSMLYTSVELSRLWPNGFCSIGDVTFESAAYVARYVMKKVTGRNADTHYERVDLLTGEIIKLVPEFSHMSLKPGIGSTWFQKYMSEVFPRDYVVMNGVKMKPPAYYHDLLKRELASFGDRALGADMDIEFSRLTRGLELAHDNTDERLAVREHVTHSRLAFKKRGFS